MKKSASATSYLRKDEVVRRRLEAAILGGLPIHLNALSYYEIRRGLEHAEASEKIGRLDEFCRRFGIVFLDTKGALDKAASIYASLKRTGMLIHDVDILIASIALEGQHTLVTSDSDFDRIHGLNQENWR